MKIKVKKNGTFDVTIQYRVIMAQEILDAAKLANMNPADLMLAAFHMMMDFAVQDPKEFSKAAKGFYNSVRSLDSN